MKFESFNKIPRLSRDITITEKLDGSNGQVFIYDSNDDILWPNQEVDTIVTKQFIQDYSLYEKEGIYIFAGSRNRWLTIHKDNYGFANWVQKNAEDLLNLGVGRHYGEWYGKGIQRGYGLNEKHFALFNVGRWANHNDTWEALDPRIQCPACCEVVPILDEGVFNTQLIEDYVMKLKQVGSLAVPGFMDPEGIVIYHSASGKMFKKTILNDEKPKGQENVNCPEAR